MVQYTGTVPVRASPERVCQAFEINNMNSATQHKLQ